MMSLKRIVWDTQDIALALISNWVDTPEEVLFWRASSNFIYRYQYEGKLFFLRFVHEHDKNREQIQAEIDFLIHLKTCGYPCSCPVKSRTGHWVQALETEKGSFYAVVFEGIEGEAIGEHGRSFDVIEAWGALLGKLHAFSAAYVPKGPKRETLETLSHYICGVFEQHPEENSAAVAFERVVKALELLESMGCLKGYIHYDFEWDNVLLNAKSGEMNVLDFDDAMDHYYALDVERCFNVLHEEMEGDFDRWEQAFLTGYKKHFQWGEAEQKALPALKAFASAYGLARLLLAVEDSPKVSPLTWYVPMRSRIQDIIDIRRAALINWRCP